MPVFSNSVFGVRISFWFVLFSDHCLLLPFYHCTLQGCLDLDKIAFRNILLNVATMTLTLTYTYFKYIYVTVPMIGICKMSNGEQFRPAIG